MATFVEVINLVRRRLRENQVADVTADEYTEHLATLCNEVKREVEDAWNWSALREEIPIAVVQGTFAYSIPISAEVIPRAQDRFRIQQVWDNTEEIYLRRESQVKMRQWIQRRVNDGEQGQPIRYFIDGRDASLDPIIKFFEIPDQAYDMRVQLILPQAELVSGTEEFLIPYWPVVLGTYSRAIAERGEDSGRESGEAANQYKLALSDAIAIDNSLLEGEDVWFTV